MQSSATQTFWYVSSLWSQSVDAIAEVQCFVAPDGKVVPVPGEQYGYTGYALTVGKDVFTTEAEAIEAAVKRAQKDVDDYKSSLKRAESRLKRLTSVA